MADWNAPVDNPIIEDMVSELRDRDIDAASWGTAQTVTNPFTGMKRWNAANNYWEEWNGSSWVQFISELSLPRLKLTTNVNPSLVSTTHSFQIGSSSSHNMAMGGYVIQARNNGAASDLHLNYSGNEVYIGYGLGAAQRIVLTPGATPSITIGGVAVALATGFGAAVSNYTRSLGGLYLHNNGADSTGFNAITIGSGIWKSLGPTDSGADNIWTAMDAIPDGAKIALLGVRLDGSRTTGSDTNATLIAYARQTGSSAGQSTQTEIGRAQGYGGTTITPRFTAHLVVPVPLDASRRFDFSYDSTTLSAVNTVSLYLKGFVF